MIKSGNLRGEKIEYRDGVGCSVWYPFDGDDGEESGVCFDFGAEDIDDFVALLQMLKESPAEKYEGES